MEIVSKITEEKLVWEIFTYVAESPLTKEKRKLQKMIEEEYEIRKHITSAKTFEEYYHNNFITATHPQLTGAIYIVTKLFENQEYDSQQTSDEIDEELFNIWEYDNSLNNLPFIYFYAMKSDDVGMIMRLPYDDIPPRLWGWATQQYKENIEDLTELEW